MFLTSNSVVLFMVHGNLTRLLCELFPGLIAGDSISPDGVQKVSGKEGGSVTLRCTYETSYSYVRLYWYRHHNIQNIN